MCTSEEIREGCRLPVATLVDMDKGKHNEKSSTRITTAARFSWQLTSTHAVAATGDYDWSRVAIQLLRSVPRAEQRAIHPGLYVPFLSRAERGDILR